MVSAIAFRISPESAANWTFSSEYPHRAGLARFTFNRNFLKLIL